MAWIFNFAIEIVSVSALVSVVSAIAGVLHSAGAKHGKNAIVVTLNGAREEFTNLDSRRIQAIVSELSKERSRPAVDASRNPPAEA